jgi:hypothetical protein
LRRFKLDFQIQENAVADMLLGRGDGVASPPEKWTYHIANSTAKFAARLPDSLIPQILTHKNYFIGGHSFELSVTKLEDHVLYYPAIHNFVFTDMFTVDHNSKTLFCFQVSALEPNKHSHSVAKLKKLLGYLDMNEGGTGEKYKVSYIYCADASDPNNISGYAFDEPDDPILDRVTRYLARVEYYRGITQTMVAPQLSLSEYKVLCKDTNLSVVREDGAKDEKGQLKKPSKADYKRAFEMYEKNKGNGRNE